MGFYIDLKNKGDTMRRQTTRGGRNDSKYKEKPTKKSKIVVKENDKLSDLENINIEVKSSENDGDEEEEEKSILVHT